MALSIKAPILPNIRRTIIPDTGHVIVDCDLSGADAQVVAWEAGDEELKAAFKAGLKIHVKNATDLLGDEFVRLAPDTPAYNRIYASMKAFVHGVNYGESSRTLAITQGWALAVAERRRHKWFSLHPAIPAWHRRVSHQLETHHRVVNPFGFHIVFMDKPDAVFTQALAWVPQSTVGNTCTRGILQTRERLDWIQPLIQVHDSGVFQFRRERLRDILYLRDALLNAIPYRDPLTIQWGVAISDRSWGEVTKMSWEAAAELRL
jgi:DNA polymerase I-like protein with 3'-5' exonuclease and polymerase domains